MRPGTKSLTSQPLQHPFIPPAHSARDRLTPPNTSTYQYYSLVLVLTNGTYVYPESACF